jgi:hypothetical protein
VLTRGGPDLIENYSAHEDEIDAQSPEQEHFCTPEVAAWAVVEGFGGDELVGLERWVAQGF